MMKQALSVLLIVVGIQSTAGRLVGNLQEETKTVEEAGERRLHYYYDDDDHDDHHPENYKIDISAIMQIDMFAEPTLFDGSDGHDKEPTPADINAWLDETELFYLDTFEDAPRIEGKLIDFRMGVYEYEYFPASEETDMMAKVLISFRGQALVNGDRVVRPKQIAKAMDRADYVEYITEHLWDIDGNNYWADVQQVQYDGKILE